MLVPFWTINTCETIRATINQLKALDRKFSNNVNRKITHAKWTIHKTIKWTIFSYHLYVTSLDPFDTLTTRPNVSIRNLK